jgi:HK97 gp10 family phage protein
MPQRKNTTNGRFSTGGRRIIDMRVTGMEGLIANIYSTDQACQAAVREAVARYGATTQALALQLVPFRTGLLYSSIRQYPTPSGLGVSVGCEPAVFAARRKPYYAPHIEYGTVHMRAQPFLGPAHRTASRMFRTELSAAIRDAINRNRPSTGP